MAKGDTAGNEDAANQKGGRRPDPNASAQADPLTCYHDNVDVPADAPRCPHPSSQCDYRELCPVIEAIRAKAKRDATCS